MRCWQAGLAVGICWLASTSSAQAQSLFERFGQAFTQETPPPTPLVGETVPEASIPEALPSPPQPATPASPRRPTLGVTVDPLNDDIVRQRRLPVRSGAMITAIVQGSPADQAGLPLGAVIVALDGRRIDSPADLVAAIRSAPTDGEVELSYYDNERLYRKRLHLLGISETQNAPAAPDPVRREPQSLRSGPLEQQLGGRGQRPVLGRVGQLLDGLVAPAAGVAPFAQPVPESTEIASLREQVTLLQQELEALGARLARVEQQLQRQANE